MIHSRSKPRSCGKKKILICTPCLLNFGTEFHIISLVRVLKKSGYEVFVACYFEFLKETVDTLYQEGANVELFSEKKPVNKNKLLRVIWFLLINFYKIRKRINPDLTNVQYLAPGTSTILILKLLRYRNIISTIHIPSEVYGKRKWVPILISKYFTRLFICVSTTNEFSYFSQSHLFDPENDNIRYYKHITIHNSLRFPFPNTVKEIKNMNLNFKIIGFIGRITEQKGLDILLLAFSRIIMEYPQVRLIIAGVGPLEDSLKKMCEDLKLSKYIQWIGYQHYSGLIQFYSTIDFLVMPSRFEGFGLTAIEAMSFGKPVIASNISGLNEVVTSDSGILVGPVSPENFSFSILQLLNNESLCFELGKNARSRVFDLFSYQKFEYKNKKLYDQLLDTTTTNRK